MAKHVYTVIIPKMKQSLATKVTKVYAKQCIVKRLSITTPKKRIKIVNKMKKFGPMFILACISESIRKSNCCTCNQIGLCFL